MMLGDLENLRLAAGDALLIDFDGTLAELGPDPEAIRLEVSAEAALARLRGLLGGAVGILSGRDVRDLARRAPPSIWRIGGHGLEVLAPGDAPSGSPPEAPATVLAPLRAFVEEHEGLRLELKGPVVALHYRAAPALGDACVAAARAAVALGDNYVCQHGKMVVEVKPAYANKGAAVRTLSEREPFRGRRLIVLGDDTTDEDAMAAAQEMGGIGVKVGDGHSVASLRTPDPEAVRTWLEREAASAA
jgi:trehalose 6-phosphate phosphatase